MGSGFDAYAATYDADLNQGLSLSGETKEYFARERVRWLAHRLAKQGMRPRRVLDYGCGTGNAGPELLRQFSADAVVGVDSSYDILNAARQAHTNSRLTFQTIHELDRLTPFDLVYCNGVFHHIEPLQRPAALAAIWRSLSSGGYLALWENNPWNPGTRLVMRRIPFDRDAILLWPRRARELLVRAGFRVLHTDFLFVFPRVLAALRPVEPKLRRIPAGAQYLVLCQKSQC